MKSYLSNLLVEPTTKKPLRLEVEEVRGEDIISGKFICGENISYPIIGGIPRMVPLVEQSQEQTGQSFGFKWGRLDSYGSEDFYDFYSPWLAEKYGFETVENMAEYYSQRERIIDLGCGSGLSSLTWLKTTQWNKSHAAWIGLDISSAIDVALEKLGDINNTHFVQGDVLSIPFEDGSFDTIFSEGVLHHTPSTRRALLSAARLLKKGGEFLFYVYRKKGPVREFTDDYIREKISPLSDEEAWKAMHSLTELGRVLTELNTKVTIPEDIPLLGIRAGEIDVQRLIYWNFAKIYWNSRLSFEENLHVNFDWYRPVYAHRQTAEEVKEWCEEGNLDIHWFHEQESGYTVRAIKR